MSQRYVEFLEHFAWRRVAPLPVLPLMVKQAALSFAATHWPLSRPRWRLFLPAQQHSVLCPPALRGSVLHAARLEQVGDGALWALPLRAAPQRRDVPGALGGWQAYSVTERGFDL
jgi:hypothetical protein